MFFSWEPLGWTWQQFGLTCVDSLGAYILHLSTISSSSPEAEKNLFLKCENSVKQIPFVSKSNNVYPLWVFLFAANDANKLQERSVSVTEFDTNGFFRSQLCIFHKIKYQF